MISKTITRRAAKIVFIASAVLLGSGAAIAGPCGTGEIIDFKEGGWNSDDFMIKIQGANSSVGLDSTKFQGYIRYSAAQLSPERLDAIRRAAALAFAMNKPVSTYSHSSDCSSATELSVLI